MNPGSRRASGELVRAYASNHEHPSQRTLVAEGRATRELQRTIAELAPRRGSVLICGETGTGKTLLARELHALGGENAPALRVINCAALPDALLADMLWQLDETVVPEASNGQPGTVLLDEVGELSPWSQALLLRIVQRDGHGRRGARFLAATHRDLSTMVDAGCFSRELLARLSMERLYLAPLRARRDEIAPLAFHFLRLGLRSAGQRFVSVDPSFVQCLERYSWPGNVRELHNAIVRALAVNESGTLSAGDLPDPLHVACIAFPIES